MADLDEAKKVADELPEAIVPGAGLVPNTLGDYDYEPWTHAMESLRAAIKIVHRVDRALDLEEARELMAELFRHLQNVLGKSREYRNALRVEAEMLRLLGRMHDRYMGHELISEKEDNAITAFLRSHHIDPDG